MLKSNIKVGNKSGLHARMITSFVKKVSRYKSQIFISKGSAKINAKSIMGLCSIGISEGDILEIEISGVDEEAAMEEIIKYIKEIGKNR